jgi:hypothetical protein
MLPPVFGVLLAFVTALLRSHASLHLENLVPQCAQGIRPLDMPRASIFAIHQEGRGNNAH